MKKIIFAIFIIVMAIAVQAQDSTCYFVSWISWKSNGPTFQNMTIKISGIGTTGKIMEDIKKHDSLMVYLEYSTEISEEMYEKCMTPDSLWPKVINALPQDEVKAGWRIEYVTLYNNGMIRGQGDVEIYTEYESMSIGRMENIIKESNFKDSEANVVIVKIEKKLK